VSVNKDRNVVEIFYELCPQFIPLKQFALMFDLSPQGADKAFSATLGDN
jgi:hypothetical protein